MKMPNLPLSNQSGDWCAAQRGIGGQVGRNAGAELYSLAGCYALAGDAHGAVTGSPAGKLAT